MPKTYPLKDYFVVDVATDFPDNICVVVSTLKFPG